MFRSILSFITIVFVITSVIILWPDMIDLYNKYFYTAPVHQVNVKINNAKPIFKNSLPTVLPDTKKLDVVNTSFYLVNLKDEQIRKDIINITNQYRGNSKLLRLSENTLLDTSAQKKAEDMLNRGYFEHIGPNGEPITRFVVESGYEYVSVGENLAMGSFEDGNAIMQGWMNSKEHKDNILNKHYLDIGVGVARGNYHGHATIIAVQHFGVPRNACPAIDDFLKTKADNLKSQIKNIEASFQSINLNSLQLLQDYNDKAKTLNEVVNQYNNQVKLFNDCATSN